MSTPDAAPSSSGLRAYFKRQNIEFSWNRIGIQALGGMAHGLFASLLIGTILGTLGLFLPGAAGAFLQDISTYTKAIQGAAMAMAIGYSVGAAPFIVYSLATVGYSSNALGSFIRWATTQQPFLMGLLISVAMGIILTLPISSAAICAALNLVGLAGGAAVAGCCAHMVGFAVCSYRENRTGGLASIGLGTSMLLVPNLLRKPVLWLPPVIASAVTGPLATCLFQLQMNGEPISSGMGTCGLVGPIGVVTGWIAPSETALQDGLSALTPGVVDWLGLILICVVLPALLSWVISEFMRKKGWIAPGDYKLV